MSYAPAIIADRRTDLKTLADDALWLYRDRNRGAGRTMGEIATCRGNVKRANAELRARGLLKDAKAAQLTKDTTGLVAAAVAPLKAAAMDYAEKSATEYVARLVADFVGKDMNVVAPRPSSMKHSREQYKRMNARRAAIHAVLVSKAENNRAGSPEWIERDPAREARFIASERAAAGLSFDAYVAKLEGKVGQGVTGATVEGRYLWQGSTLTVQKGDVTERWYTQQIINYSVLGNAYNQWPTRVVK